MRCLLLIIALFAVPVLAESSYDTPEGALDAYLNACQAGDYQAADACYTRSSREMLKEYLEGHQARDPEVLRQAYQHLGSLDYELEQVSDKRAILWPDDESVPPFFMRVQHEEEGWRIDYHFMANYIRADENGWSWRNKRAYNIWRRR